MADYSSRVVKQTIGGGDAMHEDSFILSQSQHIITDGKHLYVSMMLQYGTRVVNLEDGSFVQDFGGLDARMGMASGMCFLGDDKVVVCDVNDDAIKIFNKNDLAAEPADMDGSFTKPNDVIPDGKGNLFVAEVGDNKQWSCINPADGTVKFSVNQAGDKSFTGVNKIAYDPNNERVVVSDSDGNLVAVFNSTDGSHIFNIDEEGEGEGQLGGPQGVAFDKEGNILVADQTNNRVQVFSKDGKFLSVLGGGAVDFSYPWDVIVLPNDGGVAVVDGSIFMGWSRVQVF